MSVDTVLSIAGFLLIISLILAWCAREVNQDRKFREECNRKDDEFVRRNPQDNI